MNLSISTFSKIQDNETMSESNQKLAVAGGLVLNIFQFLSFIYISYRYYLQFKPQGKQNIILHMVFFITLGDFIVALANFPVQIAFLNDVKNFSLEDHTSFCNYNGFISFVGASFGLYNNFIVLYVLVQHILRMKTVQIKEMYIYTCLSAIVATLFSLKPLLSKNYYSSEPIAAVNCFESMAFSDDSNLLILFFDVPFFVIFISFFVIVIMIQIKYHRNEQMKAQRFLLMLYPVILIFSWLGIIVFNILTLMMDRPPTIANDAAFGIFLYWTLFTDGTLNALYFHLTLRIRNKGQVSNINCQTAMDHFNQHYNSSDDEGDAPNSNISEMLIPQEQSSNHEKEANINYSDLQVADDDDY